MRKKLTQEIFLHPECPTWAKWATVNADGCACVFEAMPYTIRFAPYWIKQSGTESQRLDGEFCSSDWRNSLIKRQYTNLDYLSEHPEELAKRLIHFDDRMGTWLAPDGTAVDCYDFDFYDAETNLFRIDQVEEVCLLHTINWLKQEHKEK